jgi:TolB-like protein
MGSASGPVIRLRHCPPLLAALLLSAACSGGAAPAAVTPARVDQLDQDAAAAAGKADALTRVGIRYYQAGAMDRAEDVLAAALQVQPGFTTALYLGRAQEARNRLAQAEQSYRVAGELARSRSQRADLDRQLASLTRARLAVEARAAIAREATLSTDPAQSNTIAVLPWTFIGTDASLAPLSVGLSHLVITDLAKISGLTLVERERIQVMLDEMAMAGEGRVDQGTAARAGRLLRASRVVQGVVRQTQDGVRLEAAVVRTSDGTVEATGGAGDRLNRLFALEKAVVLDLVGQLGIPLTPGERRALSERPTEDLQAFLAFSRGLQAEASGDYRSATRLFTWAADRDPAFGAAGRLVDVTTTLASRYDAVQSGVEGVAPSTGGVVDRRSRLPGANSRLPESRGQDNPARIAFIGDIIIIIPRP